MATLPGLAYDAPDPVVVISSSPLPEADILAPFRYFAATHPRRTAMLIGSVLASGILESAGIAALVPLLEMLISAPGAVAGGQGALSRAVREGLAFCGLPVELPVLLGVMVVLMLVKAALLMFAMAQTAHATAAVTSELRRRLLRSEMAAQWGHLVQVRAGVLATAMSTEPARVSVSYVTGCNLVARVIKASVYLGLAMVISWQTTLLAILAGGLTLMVLQWLVTAARRYGERTTGLQAEFLAKLLDAVSGIRAIRSMACERHLVPVLEADLDSWRNVERATILVQEAQMILHEPLRVLALAGGLLVLLPYWTGSPQELLVLSLLFARLHAEMGTLQAQYQRLAGFAPAFEFVERQILTAEAAREDPGGSRAIRLTERISFRGVGFRFGDQTILEAVDLEVPCGRFVALVGPSGSGKSTLLDLVIGLRRPCEGRIEVDGIPLDELDRAAWRGQIGYVPQDTVLLHDSILMNVVLGDAAIPEDRVWEALRRSGAEEFVRATEQGLATKVGERGARLSGGQRQRIALARALVRRPTLLLLDEATAALDPDTAQEIIEVLRSLRGEVTILAVSHQRELTAGADEVLRLEGGRLLREAP